MGSCYFLDYGNFTLTLILLIFPDPNSSLSDLTVAGSKRPVPSAEPAACHTAFLPAPWFDSCTSDVIWRLASSLLSLCRKNAPLV